LEDSVSLQIIIIFVLLILSAFFSGSETAFFSISSIALQKLKNNKDKSSRLVVKLLSTPNTLLITILLGNMLVNILASAIASGIAISIFEKKGFSDYIGSSVAIVVMTLMLLFFGEITPKLITVQRPIRFAKFASFFIFFFFYLFYPISKIFQKFSDLFTNNMASLDANSLDNKDLESAIKIGHKEGIIDEDEKEMFENVFESMSKESQEIMLPKNKMFAVDITMKINKVVEQIITSKYKLIPVYKKNYDNIVGVIKKKELLPVAFNLKRIKSIKNFIHPVLFVPENRKIMDILKDLQKEKLEFVIVVDEYGNVIGFITLDELIEEIVGEYKDEYDRRDLFIRRVGKDKFLIKGDMKIDEFNEIFDADFTSEEANTINGLLIEEFKKIPEKGEKIILSDFVFTVSRSSDSAIETITVKKLHK